MSPSDRGPAPCAAGVDALVSDLIASVEEAGCAARRQGASSEPSVLLDVEVSGVRCVLIRAAPRPRQQTAALSPRELEIAGMIASGLTTKEIAGSLQISYWTVSTYLRRIFAKLGVTSRAAMVARLLESEARRSPW